VAELVWKIHPLSDQLKMNIPGAELAETCWQIPNHFSHVSSFSLLVGPGLRALRVRKLRVDGAKALSPGDGSDAETGVDTGFPSGDGPIYYQKISDNIVL
jgi:hypothetical protein